ncbi:MAG: hypothetical protein WA738_06895 [Candidatus Angelobacter sp.]
MKQQKWWQLITCTGFAFLFCSCSNSSPSSGTVAPAASPAPANANVQPQSPVALIDPCSKFSAADAQAIMGVPMKVSPGHGAVVCLYEEASPKSGIDTARVSLTVHVYNSGAEEDRAWNNMKVVRNLQAGEKNITQLSGIGDEAWWDGHIEKGKVDVGGVLARKGSSDLMLESATLGYRASAGQLKTIAKRVADELK